MDSDEDPHLLISFDRCAQFDRLCSGGDSRASTDVHDRGKFRWRQRSFYLRSLPCTGLDGNFYGVTQAGGLHANGVVFKVTPNGALTALYSFCSQTNCTDGANPSATLVLATNGNLYGTTVGGGASNKGSVFKITPSGTLTTLYSFCATLPCLDGGYPIGALAQGVSGNIYGTATGGFAAQTYGTVFRITPSGALTTLYSFCAQPNCSDGVYPDSGVIQATDGNFYGTTALGGNYSNCPGDPAGNGCGTVFRIAPSGKLTTLYSFCAVAGCPGGKAPNGLVQATDGNFYGTTIRGGAKVTMERYSKLLQLAG